MSECPGCHTGARSSLDGACMDAWRLNPLSVWLGTCPACSCTQRVIVLSDADPWCDMCGWSGLRFRLWRWLVRPIWTIGYLRWQRRNNLDGA